MENNGYVSIAEIIERSLDNFDSEAIDYSVAVRHCADAISLIATPDQMMDYISEIKVHNYRGCLPENLVNLTQMRLCDTGEVLQQSTNTFHLKAREQENHKYPQELGLRYSINNNWIHTNFENGDVQVSYRGLMIDDNGYPMIPNRVEYKLAIESYLTERIAFKLLAKEQINPNIYNIFQQERLFNMGSALEKGKTPSPEKMEIIKNSFIRLLDRVDARRHSNTDLSSQERLKVKPVHRRF